MKKKHPLNWYLEGNDESVIDLLLRDARKDCEKHVVTFSIVAFIVGFVFGMFVSALLL